MGCILPIALPIALFIILAQAPALALDWTRTEIEHRAEINESLPPYEFTFKNSGATPVTITNIRTSCGCLTPVPDKETYAPGETGTIPVHFDRTGLVGDVTRTIAITTDEKDRAEPYQLTLRADLPEPLTIAPRLVFWKSDAAPATKTIDIKINRAEPIEIARATCNRDDIKVTLVALDPGRHYRLDITPDGTSTPRLAIIALQPAASLPAGTTLTAYAQVR
jgi:hypothetical protein